MRLDLRPHPLASHAMFAEHYDHVWHTLRRLGVRAAEREDLAQDVFVTFHRRRDAYDASRPLRAWLCGIARRVAVGHRRLAREKAEVLCLGGQPEGEADEGPLADERLAREEDRALVAQALAAVERDRRAILVMHDVDGVPMPRIADALGVPLNTAYSRLRLARAELAAAAQRLLHQRR